MPRKPAPQIDHPLEHDEQKAVAQYLRARSDLLLWSAIPHGGLRHPATARRLKAEGVRRGVPDLLIFQLTRQGTTGLAIELKRRRGGRVSDAQQFWLAGLASQGWTAVVARGSHEAIDAIEAAYGVLAR